MNKAGAWTQEQIEMLHSLYPYERSVDVAKKIGRSKHAIDHMASRLKIQKDSQAASEIRSKACEGKASGNFKGYRRKSTKGYVVLYRPGEEGTDKNGMIMEHRYIMAQKIGRPITPSEVVNHINGIKNDNRIENLRLMDFGEHSTHHNLERRGSLSTKYSLSEI